MAVSGSTDFNIDAAEVIQEAYERCGLQEVYRKRFTYGCTKHEFNFC